MGLRVPNKHWQGGSVVVRKNQKLTSKGRRLFGCQKYFLSVYKVGRSDREVLEMASFLLKYILQLRKQMYPKYIRYKYFYDTKNRYTTAIRFFSVLLLLSIIENNIKILKPRTTLNIFVS